MLSRSHPIILFIDRSGFSVYQDTLANIVRFNFTPDLVSSLDIVNKDQFVNLVATFIQINKIVGSSLAIILSDGVIYTKDLTNVPQKTVVTQGLGANLNEDKDHQDEVRSFLENIPFEEVLAKVIKIGNVNKVVAVNKDLVMAIADVFVSKGSIAQAIVPGFIYGQSANFTTGLTGGNVQAILNNMDALKLGNLLTNQEKMIFPQGLESELNRASTGEEKKPRKIRQYVLIVVFIILLIIFAVVYLTLGNSSAPSKIPNPTTVNATISPTLIQEAPTIAPVTVNLKNINVVVLYSVQSSEIANTLKNSFTEMGFINIQNKISETSVAEKSSIVFSQSIPADLRNSVITQIKQILPEISILESQGTDFTIDVSVGKS